MAHDVSGFWCGIPDWESALSRWNSARDPFGQGPEPPFTGGKGTVEWTLLLAVVRLF